MDANYLYNLCDYNESVAKAPGLDIALAKYAVDHPLPDGMNEKDTVHFISRNYDRLVAAYKQHDREYFVAAVAQLMEE